MDEFREGTYPGFLPVYRGSVTPVLPEILYYTINHYWQNRKKVIRSFSPHFSWAFWLQS